MNQKNQKPMKKLLYLIPLALCFIFVACNAGTSKQEVQQQEVINPVIVEIGVEGMTCTGCENSINKSIEKLEGIVEVSSSHIDKKTVVKYDESKTTEEQIKAAITQVGYTVVENKPAEE